MAEAINKIIQEDVQSAVKGRVDRDDHLRRANLLEYGPGRPEDRVDTDLLVKEVETAVQNELFDAFDDETYKMRQKLHSRMVKILFRATQKYGMGWTSPAEVGSLLDTDMNEDIMDAEMSFHSDVMSAIDNYAKALAKSLIKTARPDGVDEE